MEKNFCPLFYPRSIVLVGASPQPEKLGNRVLRSLLNSQFQGPLYLVRPGESTEIHGLRTYPSVATLPEEAELFLFATPQAAVLENLIAATAKGCRAAVIYAGGFKETGPEGKTLENILKERANAAGVVLIGPNTLGFYQADGHLNATFSPGLTEIFPSPGEIAVISQSGGVGSLILGALADHKINLGTFVGLGNRANVEFADLLAYFRTDPRIKAIALFIEGIEEGRRFYEEAARCAAEKPVVVLGGGFTERGQRVARSHTGSMASSENVYRAAFRQAGLLEAKSIEELGDCLKMLGLGFQVRGKGVAIITHTAGPSILATDVLEKGGLSLAELSPETKQRLREVLPPFIPPENPIDLAAAGFFQKESYVRAFEILGADESVDYVIPIHIGLGEGKKEPPFPIAAFAAESRKNRKGVVACYRSPTGTEGETWEQVKIPSFPEPERVARALANTVQLEEIRKQAKRERKVRQSVDLSLLQAAYKAKRWFLLETEVKEFLRANGIKTTKAHLASTIGEATMLAREIGYPVVLKIASPQITHKSDFGGVKLNLKDEAELKKAFQEILATIQERAPEAEIQGMTIEPFAPPGLEAIVGASRDPQFGPVVMFGLGGIWVEIIKDVVFRLAPLAPGDAAEMIREIKAFPLLQGFRGQPACDLESLQALILRTADLITEAKEIQELDLNPVLLYPTGYLVVDARISLHASS